MPLAFALLFLAVTAVAQEQSQPPPAPGSAQQPEVRVTYLNVCTPSEEEKKELAGALERVPLQPAFASDFEVARGRSSMAEGALAARLTGGNLPPSTWVRMRREFAAGFFSNAQYSMTRDENGIVETLVFRVRDPKELMQIAISDSVTGSDPATVLATDTPAFRVKLERFGKASVALARCEGADQKAYEEVFRSASRVLAGYRDALGARRTVPAEFARIARSAATRKKPPAATVPSSPARPQKQ